MVRQPSRPEQRAQRLFERLHLSERLKDNDGTANGKRLWFSSDQRGTSVLRDSRLYRDHEEGCPKNFTYTKPDKTLDDADFLEIKDRVDAAEWRRLSRDAFNDQMRLSLLRIHEGLIACGLYDYSELTPDERAAAIGCLRTPTGRRYVRLDELALAVPSPAENLESGWLDVEGRRLPIKVLAGMKARSTGRLFILDSELMAEWEKMT
jgi:hypothetical protein